MQSTTPLISILFFGIFISVVSYAQPASTLEKDTSSFPYWIEMMRSQNANFFETQRAFYTYWENREITPGCGYKPFKRWEAHWESRVDENGNRPHPMAIFRKTKAYFQTRSNRSLAGNWQELGPVFNEYTTIDDIHGVGRINTITFHPSDVDRIWIGAPSGGLWHSTDHVNL